MYQRTIEELQKDEREKVIIDIRREADFLRETYPGAKHIYWEEFEAHKDEVPKDCPVYLICYTGERSDELARELFRRFLGYTLYLLGIVALRHHADQRLRTTRTN